MEISWLNIFGRKCKAIPLFSAVGQLLESWKKLTKEKSLYRVFGTTVAFEMEVNISKTNNFLKASFNTVMKHFQTWIANILIDPN